MPETSLARILVVDDEAPQMKALCDTLMDHGYETVGFTTGRAALAALKEGKFHLLLSDLMMPEMDGISLFRFALEADPDLIGIIMTGEGTIATAVEAMKSGALDYILKPFKLSVILPVLSRALAVRTLRIKNAELERKLLEHTAALEAANNELESFSFSVSHDLRAPVRHIDGFLTLLLAECGSRIPDDARRYLDKIAASAKRMGQLIDDLLRFSRLGRQSLTKGPVRMGGLVEGILEELRKEWGERVGGIRVGNLPDCVGDASLLRQVFINLLSNALKFTQKKDLPVIEVDCQAAGAEAVYRVRDNGAGFDMRYADRLFGVFQRFHAADQFEGTGVGLSIVQSIVQRHGGRIWAEAAVNEGATFYFTLGRT